MASRETSPQKQTNDSTHAGNQAKPAQATANFTPIPSRLQRTQADLRQMRASEVAYLQRAIGNYEVSRLLTTPPTIQPKLKVGPVGDRYEEEADRISQQVMRKPMPSQAQRKEEEEGIAPASASLQRMPAPPKVTPLVQRDVHGKGCKCKSCNSVQRHHDEDMDVQRHPDEDEHVQRHPDEDEHVQRHPDEDEHVQRHHDDDEHVQRHHDEDESLQRSAHGKGCKCKSCGSVQRHHDEEAHLQRSAVAKDGSFEADKDIEGKVKNMSGRGRPLDTPLRSEMEGRFGGADFSSVRIHTGSEANTLNRSMSAHAFTHGNNIAFASGQYNPGSSHGKQLLAHELTHTIQQTGGSVQRSANGGHSRGCGCTNCRPATPKVETPKLSASKIGGSLQRSGIIQRHASFEHRMLGDLDPDELEWLGQWQDPDPTNQQGDIDVLGALIKKANILHVLQQEINRLKAWQRNPPKGATQEDADELMGEDTQWQVKLVSIPSLTKPQTPPLIVTYGELNTLADFYGSVQELKSADPVKRANVAQSVRNQSYEKLLDIYMKVNKQTAEAAKEELGTTDLSFAGSFNITDAVSGEVAQMMVDKKGELDKYSAYGSTLARNACHFAPESWHSWEDYHAKARKLALDAYNLSQQAQQQNVPQNVGNQVPVQQGGNSENNNRSVFSGLVGGIFGNSSPPSSVSVKNGKAPTLKEQVEEKVNEALLTNGFGDHYLQDSYAAGHLINKTQIMQWFVQWLDKHPDKANYTTDTTWRQYQAMAYDQNGMVARKQYDKRRVGRRTIKGKEVSTARNPQMVENTQEAPQSENIGWEGRFEMLGLKLPGSIKANTPALKLMLWLQRNSGYMSSWTWKELKSKSQAPPEPKGFFAKLNPVKGPTPHGLSEPQLRKAIEGLLEDQIIYMSSGDRFDIGKMKRGEKGEEAVFQDEAKFELRKEYIVSTFGGGNFKKAASDAESGDMTGLNKMMKATIYKDYVNFMKDGFLQKSTNALHDYFCKEGLDVEGADGYTVFKIYGDNAMLNKESSRGVKESAQTSRKSRDSIMEIAMNGRESQDKTTDAILDRFPNRVRLKNGSMVTLDEWHNDGALKKVAEEDVFPTLNSAAEVVVGLTSGKGLGAITKDEEVHGGEAF